ncbi:hypothetical protein HanPI659440_Chr09g0345421 [Helianthus annuus]|nr:hypothetical protein HanPI659440_Chr09g0345421 [Helianthus annuus]
MTPKEYTSDLIGLALTTRSQTTLQPNFHLVRYLWTSHPDELSHGLLRCGDTATLLLHQCKYEDVFSTTKEGCISCIDVLVEFR